MIVEIGNYLLGLALCLSLFQIGVVIIGTLKSSANLSATSEGLALTTAIVTSLSYLCLIYAFLVSDFSVANVAKHSHTLKPLLYKIAGAWASHEGSMLMWCTILSVYGAMIVTFGKHLPDGLKHKVLAVQGALVAAFVAFTLLTSNPLLRLVSAPIEGQSLNPLLQDPALAFHPPMLYLGYVGFSVVFSFAIAALIEGKVDRAFARWVRPWTLWAWACLTLGIVLGSFWAYYELGWGGWWFWDPVENASFMPWLAGTALLHSAIVLEKRDALKSWTVFLALLAFSFAMLGAFLVRSGVLSSVHAFAVDPQRGIFLLIILALLSGLGLALFAWRSPQFSSGSWFAPLSREAGLVINNVVLSASLSTVVLGTLYPLLSEAMTGKTLSVGTPYFLLTFAPLIAAMLILLPFVVEASWKRADPRPILGRLGMVGLLSIASALLLSVLSGAFSLDALSMPFGLALGAWLLLSSLYSNLRRISWAQKNPIKQWLGQPLAFHGMSLAHLGLGVFILGAVYESHAKQSTVDSLMIGQSLKVAQFEVKLEAVGPETGPNYKTIKARLSVSRGQRPICIATPERRFYPASQSTTSEVALCQNVFDDLYFVLGEGRLNDKNQPTYQVRALYNPWIHLVFFGPVLMMLGGFLSLMDRGLRQAVVKKGRPSPKTSPTKTAS